MKKLKNTESAQLCAPTHINGGPAGQRTPLWQRKKKNSICKLPPSTGPGKPTYFLLFAVGGEMEGGMNYPARIDSRIVRYISEYKIAIKNTTWLDNQFHPDFRKFFCYKIKILGIMCDG